MFSIVIIARGPNKLLDECLEACQRLRFEHEVIVNTDPGSPMVKRYNAALRAKYDLIAFLDDDCIPWGNWLINARKYFEASWIVAVGGVNVTHPKDGWQQRASGKMLEIGGAGHRHIPKEIRFDPDLPYCNFIVRKEALLKCNCNIPYFPGEDTFVCQQLMKMGKIVYAPDVIVYHHRRPIWKKHLQQIASYGIHRGYFAKKFPELSLKLRYFLPSIVLLLLCGVFLWLFTAMLLFADF